MNKALSFDPGKIAPAPAPSVSPLHAMPLEWERGLVILSERAAPGRLPPERWSQIVADVTRIATIFGDEAQAAGWSIESLFGLDPEGYEMSLALVLQGRPLIRITTEFASIETSTGYLWHHPRIPTGAPLLWAFDPRKVPIG